MGLAERKNIQKFMDEFADLRRARMAKMYEKIMEDEANFSIYLADAICALELAYLFMYTEPVKDNKFQPFVTPK